MGFLDHLEELRWRLIKSLLAIIIGSVLSFGYIEEILYLLLLPSRQTTVPINIQVLTVQGMFLIKWFISFISGFVVALPFLIYQLWKFVSPGLLVNEKKICISCSVFFFYFILMWNFIWLFYYYTIFT